MTNHKIELSHSIGDILINKLKQDYIRIENAKQYDLKIQSINPQDEDVYLDYWRKIKHHIVEGYWGTESKGYRFCPPSLLFYKNLGLIQDTDEAKNTTYIRPLVEDIEWEQAYMYFEAKGFSGFYEDDRHTSDILIHTYNKKTPETFREKQLFTSKGNLKEYLPPRQYLRMLHDQPYGSPLYFNEAENTSILGSRGGGKSYYLALAEFLHQLVIDGGQYYDPKKGKFTSLPDYKEVLDGKSHPKVELMLGSTDTDKSSELFSKIVANMNALATEKIFGAWNTPDDLDYSPSPLFKDMSGSIAPGNKKNPYVHSYKIIKNGRELTKGTGSLIYHVSYSAQKGKGKGAQAGAGGRTKISGIEEQGLVENLIPIMNSNSSVVSRNGVQFGTQANIGTSGNIDAIPQTKKVFLNPRDYKVLSYDDVWENMGQKVNGKHFGQIGFFLPFYMTLRQFKDEDGNTNYQEAFEHIFKIRKEKASSSDPSVLRDEKMNRPIIPSEMWLSSKGYYLPHDEAVQREKVLMKENFYLELANPVKLYTNVNSPSGISYELNPEAEPFFDFPIPSTLTNFDSSIVIYHFPTNNEPNDYYFHVHDPYVSENINNGGSFGAWHTLINPKYWDKDIPQTGPLVATYIAKPNKGLDHYYRQVEKLVAFYGNGIRSIAYEANRGENCKNYFQNKNKVHLLALRPQVFDKKSVFLSRVTEYGYYTNDKIILLDRLNDLLLRPIPALNNELFINTIPCLFTIKQIIAHEIKGNYDAVSSLTMAPMHIGTLEMEHEQEAINKRQKNALAFFSTNNYIYDNSHRRPARKAEERFN